MGDQSSGSYGDSVILVETSPVLDHSRCGDHDNRGVSRGGETAAGPATHIRSGRGAFERGDSTVATILLQLLQQIVEGGDRKL